MALNELYPYIAFGMASHFQGYETEYMTLLFKDLNPCSKFGIIIEMSSDICFQCKYPTDSKNYVGFLIWAGQYPSQKTKNCIKEKSVKFRNVIDLYKKTSTDLCYRCKAPEEYKAYVKKCIKEKSVGLQNLIIEHEDACVKETHMVRVDTECIFELFNETLPTLDIYEFRELIQYMCIFPSIHIPKQYIKMLKTMRQFCRKFGLTRYNAFKQKYDRWWAKEYKDQIKNNIPLVRKILFTGTKQIMGVHDLSPESYDECNYYFHIRMTSSDSIHKDNDVIEKEELIDDRSFEDFYDDHPEYRGHIRV